MKLNRLSKALLAGVFSILLVTVIALAAGSGFRANAGAPEAPPAPRTSTPSPTLSVRATITPIPPTATPTSPPQSTPTKTPTQAPSATPPAGLMVPLIDLGTGTYKGFEGGLYPGGTNLIPAAHALEGSERGEAVQPRNPAGALDSRGRYVFLSIGMSNTSQEFCGNSSGDPCDPWSFMGQAAADPSVDHTHLVLFNGADGGAVTGAWDQPADADYDRVRDEVLAPLGYSEAQVQIVWVKLANQSPETPLPGQKSDAIRTFAGLGSVLRAIRVRYPNIQQVFISSRIYAGYATTDLNPEPFAYEYGFSVKWLVEAQIEQMAGGGITPLVGDLNYDTVAPWAAWGPYLWANGAAPNSDGLFWVVEDFLPDGTHPSPSGAEKVADLLMNFFATSPLTRCWFLAVGECSP